MPPYRSRTTTHGRNMAGARGLWRATGMKDEDFGKPIIAVANSFTQFVPGHVHLKDLGQLVAREIEEAGGVAKEFNTIAVDDGIAMGHDGMLYCLPSRELIADSVEYMVNAHCADAHGLHLQLRQDHARHADGRAAAQHSRGLRLRRTDGGRQGRARRQGAGARSHRRHGRGRRRQGLRRGCRGDRALGLPDLRLLLRHVHRQFHELPDRGAGPVAARQWHDRSRPMPTASGCSSRPAIRSSISRRRYYEQDDASVLPRSIATFEAFENAMTLDIAMGGSTNTVLHLLAAAHEAEVHFTMADIDRLSRRVPVLCKVAPSVPDVHLEDVHRAGGIMAHPGRARPRRAAAWRSCRPCIARRLEDAIARWDIGVTTSETARKLLPRRARRRADAERLQPGRAATSRSTTTARTARSATPTHAFSKDGGLAVLFGNLALEGCIVKTAGVDASILKFSGPARVFESQDAAVAGILTGKVKRRRRGGDPLRRAARRAGHAGNALSDQLSEIEGPRQSLRADHRRPLLRRHLGPLHRPCLAGSGGRRADRAGARTATGSRSTFPRARLRLA